MNQNRKIKETKIYSYTFFCMHSFIFKLFLIYFRVFKINVDQLTPFLQVTSMLLALFFIQMWCLYYVDLSWLNAGCYEILCVGLMVCFNFSQKVKSLYKSCRVFFFLKIFNSIIWFYCDNFQVDKLADRSFNFLNLFWSFLAKITYV